MGQCYFSLAWFDFKKVHTPGENMAINSGFMMFFNDNSPRSVILLFYTALPNSCVTAIHIHMIFLKNRLLFIRSGQRFGCNFRWPLLHLRVFFNKVMTLKGRNRVETSVAFKLSR